MSDVSDARSRMTERLRADGASRSDARRMAEGSIRRVSEKINTGANPAPDASSSTRARLKEERAHT